VSVAGERRGGLEITSSKTSPGNAKQRPPGEVIFDLVFSNESLWTTVDPHAAQTIVEKSVEVKGVVDLGDLLREFIDRKTKVDLARGTVLAFAMELARSGIAIRLPAELQSLDRTARQKLVDVFRSGQKGADEPTKTIAAPPSTSGPNRVAPGSARPPPPRTASGSPPPPARPPSRTTPPAPATADGAIDGWGKGLGEVTGARTSSGSSGPNPRSGRTTEVRNPNRAAPGDTSGPNRPPRTPTDPGRERSRTNIERPRPASGGLALGALFGPGRLAALSIAFVFLVLGVVVGPGRSTVVKDDPLPPEIPCSRVERNGDHAFCIVDLVAVPPRLTLDEISEKKAKMLEAARRRGMVSVTFYNPDKTRWDPIPVAARIEAQTAQRPADAAPTSGGAVRRSGPTSAGEEEEEPFVPVAHEPIVEYNEDGSVRVRKERNHDD
jgi:hypothetical protein